jgi:sugar phosphate isomerase/epimerase
MTPAGNASGDGNGDFSRREFLTAAGGGALGAVTGASLLSAARPARAEPGDTPAAKSPAPVARPRVGAVSWCFHTFAGGSDPTEAIEIFGDLGFEGTDLILLARDDIRNFWTAAKIQDLRGRLEKHRIAMAQFVIFQPVVEGLTSLDAAERDKNLQYFEEGCRIGKELGAPVINIVSPWARELHGPDSYLPRYYEIGNPKPGEKFHIDIDPGFDWDKVWRSYIDTTKRCLDRVKKLGLKLSIEHHTHTVVPDALSFLALWDAIQDPDLGYNLDTGWTLLQREYPPVAIHKVRKHLMNLHVRDIDGPMRKFPHVGEGVMDFKAIAEALKAVGYTGFLSIEQDKHPGDMRATCKRYLEMMRSYLA